MLNLLVVEASPRGTASVSRHIAAQFTADWSLANPTGRVVQRDLMTTPLTFTNEAWLTASFTPVALQSDAMKRMLQLSDMLIEELLSADVVVIASPVYNYNVPAVLKAWFDHVVRKGATLGFSGEGLVTGKRCIVLLASGSVYTEGSPVRDRDIATQWLRLILQVLGFEHIEFVVAGGTKVIDMGKYSLEQFMAPLLPEIQAAAHR